MKQFVITQRESGQRMDKFLFKVLDQAPKSFIYKMLRKKNIVLNDKKATGQEILADADEIKIYLADETFETFASAVQAAKKFTHSADLDVVYEDADILIINKPAGLLSQKSAPDDDSANDRIISYLLDSNQLTLNELRTFKPSISNRLDRNTSGLLIAGKTIRGLQQTAQMLKERTVKKVYLTIVWGIIDEPGHLTGYLEKDHRINQVRVQADKKNAEFIETAYRPIRCLGDATLLEVELITGKSHQIRAHLASIGHPIIGDGKYGDAKRNQALRKQCGLRHQLLHAYRMEFPDGRVIKAPIPMLFCAIERELTNG